jgi:hypothetical protein
VALSITSKVLRVRDIAYKKFLERRTSLSDAENICPADKMHLLVRLVHVRPQASETVSTEER